MRSFIAFLACTGFIVWAHSCEKRIVGVKVYAHQPGQNVGLSFNGLSYERPLFLANTEAPVAIDALFVNIEYGPNPERDWKR
ncbi:hypothetical protein [Chitinophaga sp. CF418]|uniref:hypothetical protein n=1 Tax=Chitinophaga sp. CF418 TaxID=1855287 RepID=UPI00091A89CA|nr:hypothetical protein [Chitinophaga sp. CF418]SHM40075.1 hypothetical protein SAMN05216311_10292 [Chitinophaga sp. CF418]